MNRRQLMGLMLVTVSATAFALTSDGWLFSVAMVLMAVVGAGGRRQMDLRPIRRAILFLLVGVIFSLKWRFAPFEHTQGFVMYSLAHALGQFLLACMVVMFFLKHRGDLPTSMILLGLGVMLCAGDVLVGARDAELYHLLAMAFVGSSVFYAMAGRRWKRSAASRSGIRRAVAAGVLGGVLGLSYYASVALDRYQREASIWLGNLTLPNLTNSIGFSRKARLSSVMNIQTNDPDKIALRVRSDSTPGYLRAAAYHDYDDSQWAPIEEPPRLGPAKDLPPYAPGGNGKLFRIRHADPRRTRELDVWPSMDIESGVFTPQDTLAVRAPVDALTRDLHGIIDAPRIPAGVNYRVVSSAEPLEDPLPPGLEAKCTQVPLGLDPRVHLLAARLTTGQPTTAEKIRAVTAYFHTNYSYRLGIDIRSDEDPLTYFLLEKPSAHCEYFASGAALLLRLGGVPTRYVTGFVAQEQSPYGDYWIARNKDAHAWVEAYDREQRRWVLVEATPAGGQPQPSSPHWASSLYDYSSFVWRQVQAAVSEEGFVGLVGLVVLGVEWFWDRLVNTVPGWCLIALVGLLVLRRLLRWMYRRRKQHPSDAVIAGMQRLLARMDAAVRRRSKGQWVRHEGETLHQFARRIRQEKGQNPAADRMAEWYEAYARLRYHPTRDPSQLQALRQQLTTATAVGKQAS
ncbi:MAG: DUF3488 and DUF4129 domain-containing transglutaminase family protein [Phycisphaerae bacterium]